MTRRAMCTWRRAGYLIAALGLFACTGAEPPPTASRAAALDDPTQVTRVPAPLSAARFTALTGRSDLATLRITFGAAAADPAPDDVAAMPDVTIQAVTSSDDDHYVVMVSGQPVRIALPGYRLSGAQLARLDPDTPAPWPLTADWIAAQQTQATGLMSDTWGGLADYAADIQQDLGGPSDDQDPGGGGGAPPGGGGPGGGPPGGGGGSAGGGGTSPGGGGGMSGLRLAPRAQNGNVATELVCGFKWAPFITTFTATMVTLNRAIVKLAAEVAKDCAAAVGTAGAATPACTLAIGRLAANKKLVLLTALSFTAHFAWEGYLLVADHDYEAARIGADKDAALTGVQERRTAFKHLAIGAVGLFAGDAVLTGWAAVTSTWSVVAALGSYTSASGVFLGCGFKVLSPKAQNDAVRVAINMDGSNDYAVAGGGGGGVGLPPGPIGPPGPVGTTDDQRRFMSNKMTALPRALAMQNVMTIDLRSTTSPFTGLPADNQISAFHGASHPDAWGVGLCTVLHVDSDPGGPYQATNPFTFENIPPSQPANVPYLVQGAPEGWGGDMHASSTDVHGRQGMMERICDSDNDNDGIPDAQQAGHGWCDFAGPDQTDGLVSLTIDSPQPNRAPSAHSNCAHVAMSLVPHPQDNDIPGLTAEQILPMVLGRWVSTRYIFSVSDQYATASGDPTSFGNSQLRFEIGGTLQAPDDPCYAYQKVMDPPWSPSYPYHHEWVWDVTRPGCELSPGGDHGM